MVNQGLINRIRLRACMVTSLSCLISFPAGPGCPNQRVGRTVANVGWNESHRKAASPKEVAQIFPRVSEIRTLVSEREATLPGDCHLSIIAVSGLQTRI